jgi:nucleotide-binding universal stress UspA family protein
VAIKDILLALKTYPDPASESSIVDAVAIAAALGARLAGIACEVRVKVPNSPFAGMLIDLPGMAAVEAKKSADAGSKLLSVLECEAKRAGVVSETISEKLLTSEVPNVLAEYARLRDLTIFPVPKGDDFDQWYAETIIFGSGRPTLVLPAEWKRRSPFAFDTAVIAWDFSRAAARSVADAMPFLEKAKRVHVATVVNEKRIDSRQSASALAKHLARHGVEVVVDKVDAAGRDVGTVIKEYCASREADLLVMGAYGHSRLLEFILGGATQSVLSSPTLPVLMSH